MRIAVPTETRPREARVAATPDTIKKYIGFGAEVVVQSGAGAGAGITDADFEKAGAKIAASAAATVAGADVVLTVRRPEPQALVGVNPDAVVLAIMDPYGQERLLKGLAARACAPSPWS